MKGNLAKAHPREAHSWEMMIQRCTNPKATSYENYGGRSIKVCARWRSFRNFLDDMGQRPDGHTLDRIRADGDYEPGNCRWATRKEQQQNRRNSMAGTLCECGATPVAKGLCNTCYNRLWRERRNA